MEALGLKELSKPETTETGVSLGSLSELTGFPVEYIKRELLLDDSAEISMEELRAKVLAYLSSEF